MNDADIISAVKHVRKLIVTLDAIGFPVKLLSEDDELSKLVPKGLPSKIVNLASEVHILLQKIEKSVKYKEAIKNLCEVKERE